VSRFELDYENMEDSVLYLNIEGKTYWGVVDYHRYEYKGSKVTNAGKLIAEKMLPLEDVNKTVLPDPYMVLWIEVKEMNSGD
jgi:hypothetical protein